MDFALVLALAVLPIALIVLVRGQFKAVTVYEWDAGPLYAKDRFREVLGPGRHWLFRPFREPHVVMIRTAPEGSMTGLVDASSAERLPFRLSA